MFDNAGTCLLSQLLLKHAKTFNISDLCNLNRMKCRIFLSIKNEVALISNANTIFQTKIIEAASQKELPRTKILKVTTMPVKDFRQYCPR